jgi:hypothetical protein
MNEMRWKRLMDIGPVGSRPRSGQTYEVEAGRSCDSNLRVDPQSDRSRMNHPCYKKFPPQPHRQRFVGYEGMSEDRIKRCEWAKAKARTKQQPRKPRVKKHSGKKKPNWAEEIKNRQKNIPVRFARFSVSR